MSASDLSPPTAAELAVREEAYRKNPRSEAAIALADTYCALARWGEAVDLCQKGLLAMPDSVPARLALGRAFVGLQQWKEAQTELLKVVKLDRSSVEGFRLLGEALMRRNDFERALPILQHAQNLAPADARVLQMLKRAREGRGLDPPGPIAPPITPLLAPSAPVAAAPRPASPPSLPRPSAPAPAAPPPAPAGMKKTGGHKPMHDFDVQMTKVAGEDYGGHLDEGEDEAADEPSGDGATRVRPGFGKAAPDSPSGDDEPTRVGFDAQGPSAARDRGDKTEATSTSTFDDGDDGTTKRAVRGDILAAAGAQSSKRPPALPTSGKPPAPPLSSARPAAPPPSPPRPPASPPGPGPALELRPPTPAGVKGPSSKPPSPIAKIPLKKSDPANVVPSAAREGRPRPAVESTSQQFEIDVDPGGAALHSALMPSAAPQPAKPAGFSAIPDDDDGPPSADDAKPAPRGKVGNKTAPAKARAAAEGSNGDPDAAPAPAEERPQVASKKPPKEGAFPGATVMVAQAMQRAGANHEDFLNQLLGAGLVSVPGVQTRSVSEVRLADEGNVKRWGRSTSRAMIFIWILAMVLAGGGYAGYTYWQKLKKDQVTRSLTEVSAKLETGSYHEIVGDKGADAIARAAFKKEGSTRALAASAMVGATMLRDYGQGDDNTFKLLTLQLKKRVERAKLSDDHPTARAARIAESALALREGRSADALSALAPAAAANPQDPQVLTALAIAAAANGDRAAARRHADSAVGAQPRSATAQSLIGDLLLDEGDYEAALKAYDAALSIDPKHPLALLGRGLLRIEHARDLDKVMADVNTGLATVAGRRIESWRHLALAEYYLYREEETELANKELAFIEKAPLGEPRFLARLALIELWDGKLELGEKLRNQAIQVGGAAWVQSTLIRTVDAELTLARDDVAEAQKLLGGGGKSPPRTLLARARAELRAGAYEQATGILDQLVDAAPEDLVGKAYRELAHALGDKDKAKRAEAKENLAKLARGSKRGQVRAIVGELYLALGDGAAARRELEQALEGNFEVYRTRILLSRAYSMEGRKEDALKALDDSVKDNPAFASSTAELGRLYISMARTDEGIELLERVVSDGRNTWREDLALAEAYVAKAEVDKARAAWDRAAKAPGVDLDTLAKVEALLDPDAKPKSGKKRRGR